MAFTKDKNNATVWTPKEKLVHINQFAIKGERGTGYEGPDGKGEFSCRNCEYFRESNHSCGNEDFVKRTKRPVTNGRADVDPRGCCEYVERIGKFGVEDK